MRLSIMLGVAAALACVSREVGAIDEIPLTGETALRLATVEEGAAALAAQDDFARALSRFDLQCRMQTGDDVSVDAWQKSVVAQVCEWDPKHAAVVVESAGRLRTRMDELKLPLPKTVLVVRTTGKEEGNAAYTRGTAIMLPETVLAHRPDQFDRLLAHELFHVLSRNQPMLRAELYGLIGFQTCPPIALPPSLADRKITNPDAPLVDCYLELPDGDKTYFGAPILYASAQEYDVKAGGSLFKYLTFRLMVIEKHDGKWQPVLKDKKAVVIEPKNVPAFFEKIGRNTNYIIHPDEILADNFVHLVMGAENLATPRIVERMGRVLGK